MKNWNIRTRMLVVAVAPVICIALFLSSYFTALRLQDVERLEVEKARGIATHLAPASEFGVITLNVELLATLSSSVVRDPVIVGIRILGENRQVLSSAQQTPPPPTPWVSLLHEIFSSAPPQVLISEPILATTVSPDNYMDLEPTSSAPIGWVEIDLDLIVATGNEIDVLAKSIVITLLVLLIFVALAIAISRTVSRPLLDLTATVDMLRRGHLHQRANTLSGGELGRLELGINEMAATIQASQHRLEEEVQRATTDLQATLAQLEERNSELQEAQFAAQRASDFKSQFLANMSHEIRTPINVILGFSELLSHASREPLHRDYLETIRSSAQSLLSLLNDILDLTRVESGQLRLRVEPINVNEVLNDIHSLFAPGACDRGLEFHAARLPDAASHVHADPLRLRQILVNLVNNAIKFTQRGHVLLEATASTASDGQHWIRLTVTDTGIGIPQGSQNKLFQAFSQGEFVGRHDQGGAGLGLHIASEIVMLMEGDIAFESSEGDGSRFWVNLPLDLADLPVDTAWFDEAAPLRAQLICEYTPLRDLFESFLAQARVDVAAAADTDCDLVLIDYSATSLGRLHIITPAAANGRPVIACLPGYDADMSRQLQRNGYDDVLVKTSCPRKFRAELDRALHKVRTGTAGESDRVERLVTLQRRLLVVDDHTVNLKLMQHFGTQIGASVVGDTHPSSALQRLAASRFDLILVDLHMPEMSGDQLAREIRAGDGPNQHTPIVALTADAFVNEASLFDSGIDARLTKPISLDEFRECVDRWCGKSSTETTQSSIASELRQVLTMQLPQDRANLVEHAQREAWEELQYSAHRLHGALLYCDVPALTKACAELEQRCRARQPGQIGAALQSVLREIDLLIVSGTAA